MKRWLLRLLAAALLTAACPAPTAVPTGPPVVRAVGDLRAADRIVVLVPGVDTTSENFDRGHGDVAHRSPHWQARQLHAACGGRVAVVAWLGYLPPDGIGLAAARSERAMAGATALTGYVRQLATARPHATITVIGHSYGSLVLAYAAARLPVQVTDIVVLGSPGLDVGNADQLRTGARLWVGTAEGDWTRRIPEVRILGLGHGTNPSRPSFGARYLNVSGAEGHDGYFLPGTTSLRSLATVALGES
ncbi:alpha/beta fold hydrolase [Micromonospora fiedleri]|uniref:Alpha/beta fold hydrolase n=1 Tax=Micromonospora fiedleri TaxID=1157498 RepID=A0ABS1UVE3_9ACTN|nr:MULTISPECIES: alpha/beta hydrolase [Micromonospora]MBL6280353.1 alpha/beta fold hydrolase [Micromonospora fiedleri]